MGLGSQKEYVLFLFWCRSGYFTGTTIRSGLGGVDPDIALRTTIRSFLRSVLFATVNTERVSST